MKQNKGTGKLVGAIITGILAAFNGLFALIFALTALAILADPEMMVQQVEAQGYYGEQAEMIVDLASKYVNGFAIFFIIVTVLFLVICVMLSKSYKKIKTANQAQPYGAMGYNQYQANPYQNAYQNPQAGFQAQTQAQPQFQAQQPYAQNVYQNPQAGYQNQAQPQYQNPAGTTGYNNTQNQ